MIRDRHSNLARRFDARAATYDHSANHRWQARLAADLADVAPTDRVLDVATGTGLFLRALPRPDRPGNTRHAATPTTNH